MTFWPRLTAIHVVNSKIGVTVRVLLSALVLAGLATSILHDRPERYPLCSIALLLLAVICWLGAISLGNTLVPRLRFVAWCTVGLLASLALTQVYSAGLVMTLVAVFASPAISEIRIGYSISYVAVIGVIFAFSGISGTTGSGIELLNLPGGMIALVAAWALGYIRRQGRLRIVEQQHMAQREAQMAVLAERARIAREIHDVLAQSLGGLAIQLEAAEALQESGYRGPELAGRISRARRLAIEGLDDTRRAVQALRADVTDLPQSCAKLIESFRQNGVSLILWQLQGAPRALDNVVAGTLAAVLTEALNNARKHASGEEVEAILSYQPESISLLVSNSVSRAEPTKNSAELANSGAGNGLLGIRERLEELRGTLSIDSSRNRFMLRAWLQA
ncbi:sensor transduction protein kinase [Renibacterium salmoninarum ATCC 33209]|uniref:histidine kinase n=1 Tax=Renibacterium salmoninarum (strain ATCC 33209 / DSM 20767 / JCM 11484 / NBRC 15589 / NCIMB 2235) TaxID=288705 RepID=A9WVF7_RENSM|nr:sensor transduction protein kinase [Renibacterium salmoninarum ATCC 33209]